VIESLVEAMILCLHLAASNARGQCGGVENIGKIDALGLPVLVRNGGVDPVYAAHHLIDGAETKLGHVLANLLGEEEEKVDDVLRLAGETCAQNRILRSDANRTGVQVTLAHHDATHGNEGRCREAELFRPEQCSDHNVAARLQLSICLHLNARAQIVEQQNLLRLREAKLPGKPCMLDGAER
jgi:hypothetical protein